MAAMDIDSRSSTPKAIEVNSDSDNNDSKDADPIVASYDVYTNPLLPEHRQLLILQHPNKQGPTRTAYKQVSEVRVKSKSGFLEVDVPMSHGHSGYDRDKGLRWGGALSRSVAAKNGGSHGLAGGFGVGVPTRGAAGGAAGGASRAGGKRPDDLEHELSMLDWNEAVRQDKVLRTQTLGGQFPIESETNCRWMVGVFKGDQLHLTPATSLVHLRPQLHYLDALTEQERLSRPREGAPGAPAAGAAGKEGAASGSGTQSGAGAGAAKAIHMTIKSAGSNDGELTVDTMVDRLRKVQIEPWTKLKYEDDDSNKSWNMFTNNFIYDGVKDTRPVNPAKDVKGKGKGKAEEDTLEKHKAQWAEDEFLKAVSGLRDNQQGDGNLPGDDEVEIKAEVINQASIDVAKKAGTVKGKGKAVATPAAGPATKRGPRGKSVAFKD
ncbi:hypothetical protein F4677DRAFT_400378 [Hypoxylon crocopeplum]|nr:hypothetical protein F4677DRAFT_400378 [Hypoxylon crocopeplum]